MTTHPMTRWWRLETEVAAQAPAAATPEAEGTTVLWTHMAYGLFDRMDTDKSGLIDRTEVRGEEGEGARRVRVW